MHGDCVYVRVLLNVRVQSVKKIVIKSGHQREKMGHRVVIEVEGRRAIGGERRIEGTLEEE